MEKEFKPLSECKDVNEFMENIGKVKSGELKMVRVEEKEWKTNKYLLGLGDKGPSDKEVEVPLPSFMFKSIDRDRFDVVDM